MYRRKNVIKMLLNKAIKIAKLQELQQNRLEDTKKLIKITVETKTDGLTKGYCNAYCLDDFTKEKYIFYQKLIDILGRIMDRKVEGISVKVETFTESLLEMEMYVKEEGSLYEHYVSVERSEKFPNADYYLKLINNQFKTQYSNLFELDINDLNNLNTILDQMFRESIIIGRKNLLENEM